MLNADAVLLGQEAAHLLALSRACEIRPGLTDLEFDRIEAEYGFEFADDHRAFLAAGLPVNSAQEPAGSAWKRPWPDWRDGDEEEIRAHLGWPVAGVLSALQDGAWLDSWGPRPGDAAEAQRIAERELANAPKLVPIYAHRFLPAGRGTHGRQVLSIWRDDTIIYGKNLIAYIIHEFYSSRYDAESWEQGEAIPTWDEFTP